jgi:hypothetical protein
MDYLLRLDPLDLLVDPPERLERERLLELEREVERDAVDRPVERLPDLLGVTAARSLSKSLSRRVLVFWASRLSAFIAWVRSL